ncbi:MAG: hypothetical protein GC162_18030 [Planctomycetes bacterium]|nr:hypothetical protein [Planctomycetota bacterium]
MHVFTLLLERAYVAHAFLAAIAIGLVCSLLSVIVVLKRMAFIGQGISHAGFGGVGTAALLGYTASAYHYQHDAIVLVFCLATALLIGSLTRGKKIESDTAIGILLTATMAWGVLAQNLRVEFQTWPAYREWVGVAGYTPPWESIMFGNLMNVGSEGMWIALILAAAVIVICAAFYKELMFYAFDESVARVYGVPTAAMHYLLMVLLSLVVVVSIRLVGLILVSALMIIPGAVALMLSRRMGKVLVLAALIGVVGAVAGLWLSLAVGTLSPGACIVFVLCVLFGLTYLGTKLQHA